MTTFQEGKKKVESKHLENLKTKAECLECSKGLSTSDFHVSSAHNIRTATYKITSKGQISLVVVVFLFRGEKKKTTFFLFISLYNYHVFMTNITGLILN